MGGVEHSLEVYRLDSVLSVTGGSYDKVGMVEGSSAPVPLDTALLCFPF